jgi:hypothetical protein
VSRDGDPVALPHQIVGRELYPRRPPQERVAKDVHEDGADGGETGQDSGDVLLGQDREQGHRGKDPDRDLEALREDLDGHRPPDLVSTENIDDRRDEAADGGGDGHDQQGVQQLLRGALEVRPGPEQWKDEGPGGDRHDHPGRASQNLES